MVVEGQLQNQQQEERLNGLNGCSGFAPSESGPLRGPGCGVVILDEMKSPREDAIRSDPFNPSDPSFCSWCCRRCWTPRGSLNGGDPTLGPYSRSLSFSSADPTAVHAS